ncbi:MULTISPECIES: ThiF family adenylyltransferase [unclassified Mesorhizobium]|uniref:ThiF family adenylyltransferase n=1 Tax=unclassified Mesorhizobium TaxID=325217 RepID=UPI000FDAD83B|nr:MULTISPECIES: ThiF family adenylyltransferase [unclassified Mesorhizobium]TGQ16525.1 hypothetical protein EN862_003280 [Mesorhizobium sp. M2E.F.Ca.ET.219.01.1.1]TGT77379.1 hypothetical protein EN809_007285 [Mesorhizobium sp. M2E.F.Ca.ET.166.01.1.1]TGW03487.1 hypothetical protein EN797_007285 [Mesorhizobium sp. M2E.F.Ca.ET.154.01.1.1]
MIGDLHRSRINATVRGLSGISAPPDRFTDQRVLLTGTPEVLASRNGAEMMRSAVLLLMRMTTDLTVAIPGGFDELAEGLAKTARGQAWERAPAFATMPLAEEGYAAILSVGGEASAALPLTVITSNGWLARVSSGSMAISQRCNQWNPVGAVAAASLGAGEVFKRLLRLKPEHGQLLDGISFSLWDYGLSNDPGPHLPTEMETDLLVAGAGAIGNGVVHLLSQLPLKGRRRVLDVQTYGDENWGTCLRLTPTAAAARDEKATYLATIWGKGVEPVVGRIEDAEADANWRAPKVVLSGFDNVEARYAVQDLWPDLVIDGAIGPRLECQVSAHPWSGEIACLRCIFELEHGEPAENVQRRLTGLSVAALRQASRALSRQDVADAEPEKRNWLIGQIGKPICSVFEAARQFAGGDVAADFRPSVPFVATMSASMMVTELVRYLTTGNVGVEPRFFFSVLWGPQQGAHYPEDRHDDCQCSMRAHLIERVRAGRWY